MILGVLGKGGSGKTTTVTALVHEAMRRGRAVLAVDADHNMDLAYNLGIEADANFPYFGPSTGALCAAIGISGASYRDAFHIEPAPRFTLAPPDPYTDTHSRMVGALRLMVAGPHTDAILHDQTCSHSLTTPLKVYLPFLSLGNNDVVIVDEKAGLDGVGTGVTTGFTAALVVTDPTPHSNKAAQSIAELLDFYGTPYGFVLTKSVSSDDISAARARFGEKLIAALSTTDTAEGHTAALTSIFAFGDSIARTGDTRATRTRAKHGRNAEYQTINS